MSEPRWVIRRLKPGDEDIGYRYMWPDRWLAYGPDKAYYTSITKWGIKRMVRKRREAIRRSEESSEYV